MIRKYLLSLIIMLSCSHVILACSACQFAWFDYFLPPAFLWTAIAIVWYGLTAIISAIFGIKLKGMPKPIATWVLLIVGLALGAIMLGPLTMFPFIFPAMVAFHWMFRKDRDKTVPAALRFAIIGVGSLAVLSILIAITLGISIRSHRTRAEFLVKWSGTMQVIGIVNGLKDSEPKSLEEYRYILAHGDGYIVKLAVRRIGAIGDPKTDIPLLEEAINRLKKSYYATALQEAIDSLRARGDKMNSLKEDIKKEKLRR